MDCQLARAIILSAKHECDMIGQELWSLLYWLYAFIVSDIFLRKMWPEEISFRSNADARSEVPVCDDNAVKD